MPKLQLHWSPRSPFVRKVMIVAHETGLVRDIALVRTRVAMAEPNAALLPDNPLSKIPTLVADGEAIYDSAVICEYLNSLAGTDLLPAGAARWDALTRQSLGDGMMDTLVLWRNERMRPADHQNKALLAAFAVKIAAALDHLEHQAPFAVPFDLGHIALGCALGYLDYRFADHNWRVGRPALAAWHATFEARASVKATVPSEEEG
jgi:glutathione S-transferase